MEDLTNRFVEFQTLISKHFDVTVSLIVVNDGSGSIDHNDVLLLKSKLKNVDFLSYDQNRGKGYALRYGVSRAISDFFIITDIDLPYEADSMINIYRQLEVHHSTAAIGVRGKAYYQKIPVLRQAISLGLRTFNKIVLRLIISDTQCGLKGFNNVGRDIFLKTKVDRFLFDVEFIKLLGKSNKKDTIKQHVELREGIELSSVGVSSLIGELKDYIKLIIT